MIKDLVKLANHLDAKGLVKEADILDKTAFWLLEKKAGEYPTFRYSPREGDSASALALMALGDSSKAHLIPQPLEPGKEINLPYLPERAGTTRSFDYKVDGSTRTMTLDIPAAGGTTREQDLIDIFGYEAAKGSGFDVSAMLFGNSHYWNSPAVTAMEEAFSTGTELGGYHWGHSMIALSGNEFRELQEVKWTLEEHPNWASGGVGVYGDYDTDRWDVINKTRLHNKMLDVLIKARPNARDAIGRVIHPKIPDGTLPSGDKIVISSFKEQDG